MTRVGEFSALFTAMCWTLTAMSFEAAGKRVGSLAVNLIRLIFGFLFLSLFTYLSRGLFFPVDASPSHWIWLSLSGVAGFVFGDLCLFRAFIIVGSRIAMLIMASVPVLTTLIGWLMLHETLSPRSILGMILTVAGIVWVIMKPDPVNRRNFFSCPASGVLLAFGGALGQSVGLVLSKFGMGTYSAFAATQIRILSGLAGFLMLFVLFRLWSLLNRAVRNRSAMLQITLGSFFGPFLGVSFSLLAVQHTSTGIASTIMAIVPVLIILPSVFVFKEKVTAREVLGAVVAVSGVSILFL